MTEVLSQKEIDQLLGVEDSGVDRKAFYAILKRALDFCETARCQGLLALEDSLDREKIGNRDIFEYGMSFVIDGTDTSYIDKILSNIIKQEKDEQQIVLKTIQKEAVLALQCSYNPYHLAALLNSYTDIPLNDPEFEKIKDESVDREHEWYEKRLWEKPSIILETFISGLRKSELAIISSTPGKGKTLLALTMAKTMTSRSKPTAFISLKESIDAIMETLKKIELPGTDVPDFIPYPHPIYASQLIFSKLEQRIREECVNEKIEAVFVDSLELLYGEKEYAVWIPALKALAKELNILIVAVLRIPEGKECSQNVVQSMISSSDALKCIDKLVLINNGTDTRKRVLNVYDDPQSYAYWCDRDTVQWKLT